MTPGYWQGLKEAKERRMKDYILTHGGDGAYWEEEGEKED